ncbi:hypothetical protein C8J56DRAFT_910344 [Mycena floridula]|nr:hypothetical protein C8J56DRAFT_910344 [Mycena floridula]
MSNQPWRTQQGSGSGVNRRAVDSVQEAQRLLSVFPMASATPSSHVSRHLDSMAITAAPASFIQPNYYAYPQGNPPPYTEYASEISYLASTDPSANDSGYWESARNESVRLIRDQAGPSYSYPPAAQWPLNRSHASTFETNRFAQSVFQHSVPTTAYPTPPPLSSMASSPTSSSSSLAFALGRPVVQQQQQQHQQHQQHQQQQQQQQHYHPVVVHRPEDSNTFFDSFLARKTRDFSINEPRSSSHTQNKSHSQPSLDRLGSRSSSSGSHSPVKAATVGVVTPRKRKPVVELFSPSIKRIHSVGQLPKASFPSTPTTVAPSSPVTSVPETPSTTFSRTPGSSLSRSTGKKTLAYIDVPPKQSWMTPISSRKMNGVDCSPDDLGGYSAISPSKGTGRRTGDRDERAPVEKLISLLEDIVQAEDCLPSDPDFSTPSTSTDPLSYFSPLTVDASEPLLSPNVIRKLIKSISHVARPTKRLRGSALAGGTLGTPRSKGKGRMRDVDPTMLSRILKIVKRSVKAGEGCDPFGLSAASSNKAKSVSPVKKSAAKKKKKEKSPANKEEQDVEMMLMDDEPEEESKQLTGRDYAAMARSMEIAKDSILAAECCIALLGSDRLDKHLYSEDLITLCLAAAKNQLTKIIYPFVEAGSSSESASSPLLSALHASNHHEQSNQLLSELFQSISSLLPHFNALLNAGDSTDAQVAMSDSIIIQAIYIAIDPFFVVDAESEGTKSGKGAKKDKESVITKTLGKAAMGGLRLEALSLIRSIFTHHKGQRTWIIEEILSSLIKLSDTKQKAGQFRLRNGQSIRTVSALLLQLVQTSAHDVRLQAKDIETARRQKFAMKQGSFSGSQSSLSEIPAEPFLDEHDFEEIAMYSTGLESATTVAKSIVLFLNQRSGKGKTTKNSNEAEYRAIFEHLIADLLSVLFWPEWPAAGLLLGIACKYMLTSLDDVGTSSAQADNNAAKTIALDHLGTIAARIRTGILKKGQDGKPIKPLEEIVSHLDAKELDRFLHVHHEVASHLSKHSHELTAATLGQELAVALRNINNWMEDPNDEGLKAQDTKKLPSFGKKIKLALKEIPLCINGSTRTLDEAARVDRLAEEIGSIQSLKNSFQPILNKVLLALHAPPIFVRTKALRALGQIVTSDATILSTPNVRRAIESHLLDSSPQVRDAAVELIGKYMVDRPEVASDYYSQIRERIADTGLSVRKRVIKLFKAYYAVVEDTARQVDIGTRLVLRMVDEDETVRDLAMKTIEDLWFPTGSATAKVKTNTHDKGPLLSKVAVIMGVSGNFKDRQSPLEDMLHKIIHGKPDGETAALHTQYTEICETLIDGLLDASDLPGFTVINCIRTIYLFASAYPAVLTSSNASTLLPYLKSANTSDSYATLDYILKTYRVCIPHLPKTAVKFGQELQAILQPMIIKPPQAGGLLGLQEIVACLCSVVQHLTHDFTRTVALLKSVNYRVHSFIGRPPDQPLADSEVKGLIILIFIMCLLVEHCNFDLLRPTQPEVDKIAPGPITEHVYNSMLKLHARFEHPVLRGRILQCLGFLFRAQPTLMTLETSAGLMDAIFQSPEEEGRARLLKIMQDFLIAESLKHSAREKESATKKNTKSADVNMEELVGNTDGFADSGVSSAIVQRYVGPILEAVLSNIPAIQAPALDILSFTIKQGLAHPLQSFPVIIALETSPTPALCNRAAALHSILHVKHTSLLNTRYTLSARASFDYQMKLCSDSELLKGYRLQPHPVALLQRWYSLVREKRTPRQDFLKSLVKTLSERPSDVGQNDVDFIRYMAENFSAFEYKTQEEVFTVVNHLTEILSTTGVALLETISPSHLLSHLRGPKESDAMDIDNRPESQPMSPETTISLMRTSVIIAIVMLLKTHLKTLYGLSEDKCRKYVAGKKSAMGDKAVTRKHEKTILWNRLAFATKPISTVEDAAIQKDQFLLIWNEDGVSQEPEDDMEN